jgi:putative photosynthetic complex assembly protein
MNATPVHNTVPSQLVKAMFALALFSLIAVTLVRVSGISIHTPDAPAAKIRSLRFEDVSNGSIRVIDAQTQQVIQTVTGEAGFLRGSLRGLARERRRSGFNAEQPFLLIARTDGRLTLLDPTTQQRIDLESFGPANSAVFAALLNPSIDSR